VTDRGYVYLVLPLLWIMVAFFVVVFKKQEEKSQIDGTNETPALPFKGASLK